MMTPPRKSAAQSLEFDHVLSWEGRALRAIIARESDSWVMNSESAIRLGCSFSRREAGAAGVVVAREKAGGRGSSRDAE